MAKTTVTLKIDVSKIEKERLFKGQKGTYLDAVVFLDTEADQYENNGMIVQSVSKEERAAGKRGAILGNARIIGAPVAPEEVTAGDEEED
ncbi:MAG: hypothetical protein ACRDE7_06720, partial [Sphingobacterium sp.]